MPRPQRLNTECGEASQTWLADRQPYRSPVQSELAIFLVVLDAHGGVANLELMRPPLSGAESIRARL